MNPLERETIERLGEIGINVNQYLEPPILANPLLEESRGKEDENEDEVG